MKIEAIVAVLPGKKYPALTDFYLFRHWMGSWHDKGYWHLRLMRGRCLSWDGKHLRISRIYMPKARNRLYREGILP